MYGHSSMRAVRLTDGKVLTKTDMASQWFGEGTTRLGDKLYQIVWLSGAGFIYSIPDLKQVRCSHRQLATLRLRLHIPVVFAQSVEELARMFLRTDASGAFEVHWQLPSARQPHACKHTIC
jgi:hypothetical protein